MGRESSSAQVRWCAAVVALVLALVAPAARAEGTPPTRLEQLSAADRERARGLMDEGDEKMERGDARGALADYTAAHEIVGVPTTGIEVGRAQAALGLWVEARDTWVQVSHYPRRTGEPRPFTEARREAERLAIQMAERIPTVAIDVAAPLPPGLDVRLDGQSLSPSLLGVPLRINPGHHRVEAKAPGRAPAGADIEMIERMAKTVRFSLKAAPARAPARQLPRVKEETPSHAGHRWAMWSGFAVAAAGVAAGTTTGIWAVNETRAVADQCDGDVCPPVVAPDLERARLAGNISTVAFTVGGVGLGIGLWQAVVLKNKPERASAMADGRRRPGGLELVGKATQLDVLPGGARLVLAGTFP